MTASEELASEIADLLVRHGSGGGWVAAAVRDEGPLVASAIVIDAARQRSFAVTVEERLGDGMGG